MCIDHPMVQELIGHVKDRRVVTYGLSPQADFRLLDLRYENAITKFSVRITDRLTAATHDITGLELQMPATITR